MTAQLRPELKALLDEIIGPKPIPKPKVVVSDKRVIRDADVVVSPKDPNAKRGKAETVRVRRPDTFAPSVIDAQWWDRQQSQTADRQRRRDADPFNLGHWGPSYD